MPEPRVIVVGGGLAGLVVTREMRLAEVPVLLLESSDRLGGKASSHRNHDGYCTLYAPCLRNAWHNLTSGLVPWWVAVLGCYAALDVASTTFHPNSFLDRVSRSRR